MVSLKQESIEKRLVMKPRWLHALNLKDSYTPQNTSKTRTNVDNVMIKL
jgi:hypothetical protein